VARVGIVGVSGYGGGELLRLIAGHPSFELAYVAGEASAGQGLAQRFPWLAGRDEGALVIQPFDPEKLPGIDLLFVSLPTGKSRDPLARVPKTLKIVDLGGDHRFVDGWTYGLTELPGQREQIARAVRLANPGCYPAAALLALAPLVKERLVELDAIVIDAKSGVTGAGRGGASALGYAETNEDLFAYGLGSHPHVPEIETALAQLGGAKASVAFTAHLVPMSRGLLATCYARAHGAANAKQIHEAASALYRDEPFVRVVAPDTGVGPHTGWATGSNFAFVAYAINSQTGLVVALAAIDNLGKGAAGQALQNANLMTGQPESAGLLALALRP
jgi:N-acetyl-gamma-glutamyl-phosphate reductase